MVGTTEKIQEIDKAKIVLQNIDKQISMQDDNRDVWISCMIRKTPRGYSIWIPEGAFK